MGSQVPPGGDPVGAANIAEAMRLFEEYKRRQAAEPPPPPPDTAGQGFGALFQRGFETVAKPLGDVFGGAMHVAGIPARAVAAVGTNMYEGSQPVDVSDYALLGQDMETGAPAAHYGDILAGHLAETGEIARGGIAEKLIAAAGNAATDPAMAAPMMGAAEGAASLAGRVGPSAPLIGQTHRGPGWRPQGPPGPPKSRLNPAFGPMPGQAPPKFNPTATQPVRGVARVGGDLIDPTATQPVKTVKPTGSSMEAKFVAQRAQGRPSGGLEEKFSKARAPKEANYRKGAAKKGKAKPAGSGGLAREIRRGTRQMKAYDNARGPKAAKGPMDFSDRGAGRSVADRFPERPYPKGKTGHGVDPDRIPEHLKPKSKRKKGR